MKNRYPSPNEHLNLRRNNSKITSKSQTPNEAAASKSQPDCPKKAFKSLLRQQEIVTLGLHLSKSHKSNNFGHRCDRPWQSTFVEHTCKLSRVLAFLLHIYFTRHSVTVRGVHMKYVERVWYFSYVWKRHVCKSWHKFQMITKQEQGCCPGPGCLQSRGWSWFIEGIQTPCHFQWRGNHL